MKFIIDSSGSVSGSLSLKVAGFSIDVSDISVSGKIAVIEHSGNITIEVLPIDDLPSISLHPEASSQEPVISSENLFQRLVLLRKQIAHESKLPPYMIFHDSTLKDMVAKFPADLLEMKDISGVGQAKFEKYGSRFLDVILQFVSESEELNKL